MNPLTCRRLFVCVITSLQLLAGPAVLAQSEPAVEEPTAEVPAPAATDSQLELRPEAYVAGSDSSTAPLQLLDLRVRRLAPDAVGVALYWTTSSEPDSTGFVIERFDESATAYRRVAVVPGHLTASPHSYSFVDAYNDSADPSIYRLRRLADAHLPSLVSLPQTVPAFVPGPVTPDEEPSPLIGMAE